MRFFGTSQFHTQERVGNLRLGWNKKHLIAKNHPEYYHFKFWFLRLVKFDLSLDSKEIRAHFEHSERI